MDGAPIHPTCFYFRIYVLIIQEAICDSFEEIANHQATISQVALNWLIHFSGEIVVTIPGATKAYQAKESAGAMKFVLNEEELDRLDRVSRDLKKK